MDKEQITRHLDEIIQEKHVTKITTVAVLYEEPSITQKTEIIEGEIVDSSPLPRSSFIHKKVAFALYFLLAVLVFWATFLTMLYILPQANSATILISPSTKQIAVISNIQVSHYRILVSPSLTTSKTIVTTGIKNQIATSSHGAVTFFNAAPYIQRIDAGMLLIGSDGVQVVTDETAIIPPANAPIEGQISVLAHSINVGSNQNIQAFDLNGACCKNNVFVKNYAAFTGGLDARNYHVVTQQDIARAIRTITRELEPLAKTSLVGQLRTGEAMIPPLCSLKNASNHNIGEEASQISITGTQICTTSAYNTHDFDATLSQSFSMEAQNLIGTSYFPIGSLSNAILKADKERNVLNVQVRSTGSIAYCFRSEDKVKVIKLIAGKNRIAAMRILLRYPGIAYVQIKQTLDIETLPSDSAKIHLVVSLQAL